MMAATATSHQLRNRRNVILKAFLRGPLLLYKTPLRFLLGRYYLRIKHRGRKSGKIYSTMVDVGHVDRDSGEIFVSSGWGTRSDWWKNIDASPAVEITIGGRNFVPEQRFLDEDEAYEIRKLIWRKHPLMSRLTLLTVNYPAPKIDKDFRKWARDMPFVAFRPAGSVEN